MLKKLTHLNDLFDCYESMLTDKQKVLFKLYYHQDLSLGEIAEHANVSRQAVYDILKRVTNMLYDYENKLQLLKKEQILESLILEIESMLDNDDNQNLKDVYQYLIKNLR